MLKKIVMTSLLLCGAMTSYAGEIHRFDKVKWESAGIKGVDMAVLWGKEEDSTAVYAFRIQPGVVIPAHTHSRDYWGVAVQGKWVHIDSKGKKVKTGQEAFVRIHGNDVHADSCAGPKACINIVDFDGARDIAFPK
jgi:anti-sigma factor ChrR (cupin superfamily)